MNDENVRRNSGDVTRNLSEASTIAKTQGNAAPSPSGNNETPIAATPRTIETEIPAAENATTENTAAGSASSERQISKANASPAEDMDPDSMANRLQRRFKLLTCHFVATKRWRTLYSQHLLETEL